MKLRRLGESMDPIVRTLTLRRFRSIPNETVEFDNLTFLVGRNGAGKSNFADAFAFLAEAMASPLHAVFARRGGLGDVRNRTPALDELLPNVAFGIEFGPINAKVTSGRYGFEIEGLPGAGFEVVREQCMVAEEQGQRFWFDRQRTSFSTNVPGLAPAVEPLSLALPLVGGDARFAPVVRTLAAMRVYSIDPANLKELHEPESGEVLRSDGSNAASVLLEIEGRSPEELTRIHDLLAAIVPALRSIRALQHGNKFSLILRQEWGVGKRLKTEAFNISDGTLRALGLVLAVYQKSTPSVMVIEEPEATIHPSALGVVLDLLRSASRKTQVIVTTHSPDVLDHRSRGGNSPGKLASGKHCWNTDMKRELDHLARFMHVT